MSGKPSLETLLAQGMGRVAVPNRDIVPPIHTATTYERAADGTYPGGRVYSRADNPTYDAVEALVAALENAAGAMVFASGQAAAAAFFQALSPGDRVLAPRNMYWALRKWLLDFAVCGLARRPIQAMRWYNKLFLSLGLFLQRRLAWASGLIDVENVDELLLVCRRGERAHM